MNRLVKYQSGVTANGTYCAIDAINVTAPQLVTQPGTTSGLPDILENCTIYCFAAAGTTGGVVVPVMRGPDGNYYPLAAPTTLSAAGYGFLFQMSSSAIGIAAQITTPIVGGSVFLLTIAIQV